MKILVVDDHVEITDIVVAALEGLSHQITVSNDARDAQSRLENDAFDALIVDIIMPNKSGVELIQYARKHRGMSRFLAMTGGGRSKNFMILEALKSSFDILTIQKPFRIDDLVAAVKSLED